MVLHCSRGQRTAAHARVTRLFTQCTTPAAAAAPHHHEGVTVRAVQRLNLATAQQSALLHHLARRLAHRIASHLQAVFLLQAACLFHALLDLLRALDHHVIQAVRVTGRRLLRGQWRSLVAARVPRKVSPAER